jgi:predicted porin
VVDPRIFGASLAWGPLGRQVGVSWERHDDYFGLTQVAGSAAGTATNPSSRDQAVKVFGEVKLGIVRLAAFADRIEYRNHDAAPGAIDRYERAAVNVIVQPIFGAHRPWIAWTRANAGSCSRVGGGACGTNGLGATQLVVGWLTSLSKRTEVYLVAQWLDNGSSASYATLPPLAGAVPGARYTAAGIGITHYF